VESALCGRTLFFEAREDSVPVRLNPSIHSTPLAAFAFMVFVLLYPPCIPAALAIAQELGSWKWFGVSFLYQTTLAWGVAFLVYQGGRLLGYGG